MGIAHSVKGDAIMKYCCENEPSHFLVNANNKVLLACEKHYKQPYCHAAIKTDFDLVNRCYL